jgi:ATP-dependent RNA helicase RhlE
VINFDVPQHPEDYIHRIGRTGRAEATGDAFTLMVAEDATHVYAIERFISQKIPREKLDGFDYRYTALFEQEKQAQAGHPGKVQAVRVRGGYFFSPGGGRRRRR